MSDIPFEPINNRVLVRLLPYRPSKVVEVVNQDNAFLNEGIIEKLPKIRLAKKIKKDNRGRNIGYEYTGIQLPIELNIGDRIIMEGTYQMEDTQRINGEYFRWLDYDDIKGIIHAEQPPIQNAVTGEAVEGGKVIVEHA